jgi:uncharacterized protein YggE
MKLISVLGLALISTPLMAQQSASITPIEQIPEISIASHGEAKVAPDRATIQISVQTRAATAAAAASENATKQAAVIAAIRALGIGADQISTTGYNVYPEQRYEPNREPTTVGYNVTNTVSVDVRKLDQIGPVIDAALSKGANMISSLQFYASNTDEARRSAITSAVQKGRLDAEAAARAAGGSLGALIEINVGVQPQPRPIIMARTTAMQSSEAAPTPISPGDQTVAVDITARWRFIGR